MRRLLNKLPHRHRDDSHDTSDQHPSSQPEPIKASSPRTTTVFYDADNNNSTVSITTASDGRPRTPQSGDSVHHKRLSQQSKNHAHKKRHSQQSKDDAHHSHSSTLSSPKRKSALVSYDQPVDSTSIHRLDSNKSKTRASNHGLQLDLQDTSLSDDLSYLTLGGDARDAIGPSRKRYSEDVADRNIMLTEKGHQSENTAGRRGSIFRVPAQADEFSEDIADRNIEPPPRLSESNTDLGSMERQHETDWRIATSPLSSDELYDPRFELDNSHKALEASAPLKLNPNQVPLGHHVNADFKDLDFNDSVDVDFQTRYAPAVTHETVIPEVHHVKEEVVTREIHNYHICHRILPIKDVEVLPAKHFLRDPTTGNLTEIPAPPQTREGGNQHWQLVETDSDSGWQPAAPRTFTARTFGKDEGMFREYLGEDGVPRTETTWVHPPTIQDGGHKTGQTEALFMDEFNDQVSKGNSNGRSGG